MNALTLRADSIYLKNGIQRLIELDFLLKAAFEILKTRNVKIDTIQAVVVEKKGYTMRLKVLGTFENLRTKNDVTVGSLVTIDASKINGDLIETGGILSEEIGDTSQDRIEVCIDDYNIGDKINDAYILRFGISYTKKGKKMAYAYFQ